MKTSIHEVMKSLDVDGMLLSMMQLDKEVIILSHADKLQIDIPPAFT